MGRESWQPPGWWQQRDGPCCLRGTEKEEMRGTSVLGGQRPTNAEAQHRLASDVSWGSPPTPVPLPKEKKGFGDPAQVTVSWGKEGAGLE